MINNFTNWIDIDNRTSSIKLDMLLDDEKEETLAVQDL